MNRSFLVLGLCLLLSACGSAAPSATSDPAGSAAAKPSAAGSAATGEKVRGAWVAVGATQSPLWAAKEGGFFTQNGIEPDLTLIRGSSTAAAALLSQNVDVVEMSGPGTVNASSHGADIVMIAGFVNYAVYKLMADPSIKTVDDLKGKTIAVSQIGGQDDFILRKVLKTKGLTPDVDVHIIATKDIPGSVAALKTKQVQAAILAEPEHVPALEAGAHELIDITGMHIPFAATGLVATRSYLKAHHTAAVGFLKSVVQGIRRIKSDRAFTDGIMSKYLKTDDKATLDAAWQTVSTVFEDKPYPSIPGLQEVIDENNVKGHKPEEFADSTLVKELDDAGFFAQK
jgi:ABC-type nitrate/sulfonate/bicarbonate transport system substrate-binding protein